MRYAHHTTLESITLQYNTYHTLHIHTIHFTSTTTQYTFQTTQHTFHTTHHIFHITHSTPDITFFTPKAKYHIPYITHHSTHSAPHSIHYTLHTAHCTLHITHLFCFVLQKVASDALKLICANQHIIEFSHSSESSREMKCIDDKRHLTQLNTMQKTEVRLPYQTAMCKPCQTA